MRSYPTKPQAETLGVAEIVELKSTRGPVVAGSLCLLLLVAGFGGWGFAAHLSGAVIASGRIEVAENRQVVQHLDGGVVDEILVQEGDAIEAGDLLIRLDAEVLASELAVVEGQLLEILARRARLEAEEKGRDRLVFDELLASSQNPVAPSIMAGAQDLFEVRLETAGREAEQLARRQDQVRDQIVGIESQQDAARRRIDLLSEELRAQQTLMEQGLTQAARVLDLEGNIASLDGTLGELASSKAQALSQITETDIELLRIEATRREEASAALRDLQINQIELTERRGALLTRLERLDVRAPVSGVVYSMTVFAPRSVIRAAEPVLYIVPQNRLVVATQVEPIDVDEVHVGQEVRLRFSGFDQRRTPELIGHVVRVSADTFQEEATARSFYRASIEIAEGEAAKIPDGLQIVPGMPVEAFIRTGDRSPIEYLIRPLSGYFSRAFREA